MQVTQGYGQGSAIVTQGYGSSTTEGITPPAVTLISAESQGSGSVFTDIVEIPAVNSDIPVLEVTSTVQENEWVKRVKVEQIEWKDIIEQDQTVDLLKEIRQDYSEKLTELKNQLQKERTISSVLRAKLLLNKIKAEYGNSIYSVVVYLLKQYSSKQLRIVKITEYWTWLKTKHRSRYYYARDKLITRRLSKGAIKHSIQNGLIHPKYLRAKQSRLRFVNFKKLYELSKPKLKK